jgi:DNA-binding NtrC family response regulator
MSTASQIRVLLVDDNADTLGWMQLLLNHDGYETRTADSGAAAEQVRDAWHPQLVLMDLRLPDIDGTELLSRFKEAAPTTEVIMISGHGSVAKAVNAMKAGAYSFIEKPVDPDVLLSITSKALERLLLSDENQRLRAQLKKRDRFGDIIGSNEKMQQLYQLISLTAPTDANILIHGESGTGKELVATAVHQHSKRSAGPFIKINCAAVPAELIESELFGHRKGAFTGATADKVGLVQLAEGGSLLLDEIAEVPQQTQVKLLRLLQEREFRPVGGSRLVRANFRLICATNASLDLPSSKLREDLYFRINTITLEIPPLRERPDDIPLFCDYFLTKFASQHERPVPALHPSAQNALLHYNWPGNVRELEHVLERAVILSAGRDITVQDLPEGFQEPHASVAMPDTIVGQGTLAEIERMAILRAMEKAKGNKRAAASMLGVYRPTLYGKLRKHKLGEYAKPDGAQKTKDEEPFEGVPVGGNGADDE